MAPSVYPSVRRRALGNSSSTVPVLVLTAASANHYNHLRCMLSTLAVSEPGVPVLVFALDSEVASSLRKRQLKAANPRVQV